MDFLTSRNEINQSLRLRMLDSGEKNSFTWLPYSCGSTPQIQRAPIEDRADRGSDSYGFGFMPYPKGYRSVRKKIQATSTHILKVLKMHSYYPFWAPAHM